MKLFQFGQMVPTVPKFECSFFNNPNMIEGVMESAQFVSNGMQI